MTDQPEVTLDRLREMLDMLRRTVEAGSDLDRRINVLEKATKESFNVLVTLQQNQQAMLQGFETQSNAQNRLNTDLTTLVQHLADEVQRLKGGGLVM